jgi:hypothetical protein
MTETQTIIQATLQGVTWVLIVLGWMVVNHQNNKRETRKEARSMSDLAKIATKKISSLSEKYLTTVQEDEQLSLEIKSELELLEVELERFPDFSKESPLMTKFSAFADSITGGEFEAKNRRADAQDADSVRKVRRSRTDLLSEIENQFSKHFK